MQEFLAAKHIWSLIDEGEDLPQWIGNDDNYGFSQGTCCFFGVLAVSRGGLHPKRLGELKRQGLDAILRNVLRAGDSEAVINLMSLTKYEADWQTLRRVMAVDGWNAVHYACRKGYTEIADYLLKHNTRKAKLKSMLEETCERHHAWTPLHAAACFGHESTVLALLELASHHMILLRIKSVNRNNPFHLAAREGHAACIDNLVGNAMTVEKDELLLCPGHGKNTALHFAAKGGHMEAATALLYHISALHNNFDVVIEGRYHRKRAKREARQGSKDSVGSEDHEAMSAEEVAQQERELEESQTLAPLMEDGEDDDEEFDADLCDQDAHLKYQNQDGHSPLHCCCMAGHDDVARAILQAAVSVQQVLEIHGKDGNIAMHLASANGHEDVVKTIMELAPNKQRMLEADNKDDNTPLRLALLGNHASVAEILLEYEPTAINPLYGFSDRSLIELYIACMRGHANAACLMEDLIKKRDNTDGLDETDENEQSCLGAALAQGHVHVVDALLAPRTPADRKAKIEAELHHAVDNDSRKKMDSLLKLTALADVDDFDELLFRELDDAIADCKEMPARCALAYAKHPDKLQQRILGKAIADRNKVGLGFFHMLTPPKFIIQLLSNQLNSAAHSGDENTVTMIVDLVTTDQIESLVTHMDDNGSTPFYTALDSGFPGAAKAMLQNIEDETVQHNLLADGLRRSLSTENEAATNVTVGLMTDEGQRNEILAQEIRYSVKASKLSHVCGLLKAIAPKTIKPLLEYRGADGEQTLHFAARYGQAGIITTLLTAADSANVDYQKLLRVQCAGSTPLHRAVRENHNDAVAALLELCSANHRAKLLKEKDGEWCTALHYAAKVGQEDVVRTMLGYADDPQELLEMTTTRTHRTALHLAAVCGDPSAAATVRAILEGAPNQSQLQVLLVTTDYEGCNALHLAVNDGSDDPGDVDKVRVLLDLAPDPQALLEHTNQHGRNSLHLAVKKRHVNITRALLENAPESLALSTKTDHRGHAVLYYAARQEDDELSRLLLELVEDRYNLLKSLDKDLSALVFKGKWYEHAREAFSDLL